MAGEFQPYFYLTKKDIHSPNQGKMVGLLLVAGGVLILFLKILGIIQISWIALLLLIGFGVASLILGKTIHRKAPPDVHQMEMLHSR